jgi:hypothetical protein
VSHPTPLRPYFQWLSYGRILKAKFKINGDKSSLLKAKFKINGDKSSLCFMPFQIMNA